MAFKRYLPDGKRDNIVAKALFLRTMSNVTGQVRLTPAELKEADDSSFEYDLLDDGTLIVR